MFTGIIEKTGMYGGIRWQGEAGKLVIKPETIWKDLQRGESIAVNGVCLTLESEDGYGNLTFHVMRETFSRTNLGDLIKHPLVNLERAMLANGRFGGHIVSGHVDTVSKVLGFNQREDDFELRISMSEELKTYIVWKGSVCVNGVSLTVSDLNDTDFTVSLIPTTLHMTNLGKLKTGDLVNLECDMIGKYVHRQLELSGIIAQNKKALTMEDLNEAGF